MRIDPFKTIDATKEAQEAFSVATRGIVQTTCAADIKPEPINWLWNGWLAAGKVVALPISARSRAKIER